MKRSASLLALVLVTNLHAGSRSSANYSITTETADSAGARATSAAYTNDGSAGGVVGLSTVASPAETSKGGYIGQLYEVRALQLAALPVTVNEGGTRQLGGVLLLDDASILALAANTISWTVQSGPLTGIDSSGIATAGTVYQDASATVQGAFGGLSGILSLMVVNVNNDDLPGYAGDGIDDAWQFQYFGLNNPAAAPTFVSDGSGLTNQFKYLAGLVPGDANSTFHVSNALTAGQAGKMDLVFSPVVAGRTYTVEYSDTLAADSWLPLTNVGVTDSGSVRTITDNTAPLSRRFYRVVISKP
jgi:hypothetical protein